ncbi:MAG: hypothetical protein NXI12_09650 [Alphaproteobacteria bacterium]|nr:hypothetical protein [Alphaproteobacteria bacterium]
MSAHFRNRALIIAGLAVAVWVLSLFLRPGAEPAPDQDQATLLELLRAAEAEAAWPGLDVESAAAELETPEAAAAFLRSGVVLQDYAGRFADPNDVLLTRGGNGEDQAALLRALVEAMGYETRLREADWPAGPFDRRLQTERDRPAHHAVQAFLAIDPAAGEEEREAEARALVDQLRAEVDAAFTLLSEHADLAEPGVQTRPDRRILVEYRDGDDAWRALDPVFAEPAAGTRPVELAARSDVTARLDLITSDGARVPLGAARIDPSQELTLSFAPASGLADYFEGPPEPADAALWRPVFQQGGQAFAGQAFTPAGRPAIVPEVDDASSPAPVVNAAEIVDTDTGAWPEVTLTVRTDAPDNAPWRAAHIRLSENGAPVRARVAALPRPRRDVAVITDVSPSMTEQGRIFIAGQIGRALLARTPRPQLISAATAAGTPQLQSNRRMYFNTQMGVDAFETGLVIRAGDDLTAPIAQAARPGYGPIDVVVLTDGEVGDDQLERLNALRGGERRIYAVVPERQAARFAQAVDRVFIMPADEAAAAGVGQAIAAAAGGVLSISYVAEAGEPGAERALELSFEGGPAQASAAFTAPDGPAGEPRLELSLVRDGAVLGEPRTLVELGGPESGWALMAQHALLVSGGRVSEDAMLRAFYGQERWVHELGLESPGASPPPGPDFVLLTTAQQLTGLTEQGAGAPITGFALQGLLVTAAPSPDGGSLSVTRTLDLLSDGGLGASGGARAGLAVGSAEAAALGVESVNAALVRGARTTIDPRTPLPDGWPEAALRTLRGAQATLVAAPDGGAGWLIDPSGQVTVRLFEPAAKGARVTRIVAQFDTIRHRLGLAGAVASGLLSPYNVPGQSVGAVTAILDFDVRLFCASSVALGFLNEELEQGYTDEPDWIGYAEDKCAIDLDNTLGDFWQSFTTGVANGWLGDRLTDAAKAAGGPGVTHSQEVIINTEAGILITDLQSLAATAAALHERRPPPLPGRTAVLASESSSNAAQTAP